MRIYKITEVYAYSLTRTRDERAPCVVAANALKPTLPRRTYKQAMRSRFSLLYWALLLSLVAVRAASAQTAAVVVPAPEFPQVRLDAFNKVWNTVNERHYDQNFNGVDWAKVRLDYLPKAQAARTDEEFHAVLRQMLGELKLSHFSIFQAPPATNGTADVAGGVGIDVILLDGKPVIKRVQKGSTAETAGLRPGFVIESIDGK